jgi:carboxymethylenebutenolidase
MAGTDITIHGADGDFAAYLALPASGAGPGLVVIQEIFGVNQVMREVTDWFAAAGYVSLCPDLFWRQEPGIQISDKTEAEWQQAFQLYQGFSVDKGIEDITASIAALKATPGCNGRIGSTGYCLGGLLAYLTGCRTEAQASVGYYGVGIEKHLDEAANITGRVLLHIAEADKFVPREAQAAIAQGLAGNAKITLHSYPGMEHAFCRIGGEHYDADAADLANQRTLAFFNQHLQ